MVLYDWLMVALLALGVVQGAWRGMAWQVAPITSLLLGLVVAFPLSSRITHWFGSGPSARYYAAMALCAVIALVVYSIALTMRKPIERIKLMEGDRLFGAVLGGVKGALVGLFVTFFAVGLSEREREYVLNSRTGASMGRTIHQLEPIMPAYVSRVLGPHLATIHDLETHEPAPAQVVASDETKPETWSVFKKRSDDDAPKSAFLDNLLQVGHRTDESHD